MGAENRSGKREFQERAGVGFCVFMQSRCENLHGKFFRSCIKFDWNKLLDLCSGVGFQVRNRLIV